MKQTLIVFNLLLLSAVLLHSVYRDFQLEQQYASDLRNRVVGARLQEDGVSPYFFLWMRDSVPGKPAQRYMDPAQWPAKRGSVSNITASPFFHTLLRPICDLPEASISRVWMWLQYVLLAGMLWMMLRLSPDRKRSLLIINAGILFTCTEAWKASVADGQMYFFIAFLMCGIISGLLDRKMAGSWLAPFCAVLLTLIRPPAAIFILPFFFEGKKYRKLQVLFFSGLILYGLFVWARPFQTTLWRDYAKAIHKQIVIHQAAWDNNVNYIPTHWDLAFMEGIDFSVVRRNIAEHPIPLYSENGNFFVLFRKLTGKHLPLTALEICAGFTLLGLLAIFSLTCKNRKPTIAQTVLFGLLLYMLTEFFSPVSMHQYYAVRWLPLILLGFLQNPDWETAPFLLLVLGFVLNIANSSWLPMRHTLGEIAWYAGCLMIVFSPRLNEIPWKQPS